MTRCLSCMEEYEEEYGVCPHCGTPLGLRAEEPLHMEPGSILRDRYIIGRALGFGGFGVTYIAWDALLEMKVAIKEYLPSEFATRMPGQTQITIFSGSKQEQFESGMEKFSEEAQRLIQFHSEEGIVKVYDSFEGNNTAYIVMELLQGETLKSFLGREGKVEPARAFDMLLPVINSLSAVNAQGIIHRDIAPDNIFLCDDGSVKVIDFGSARFATTSHSRSLTVLIKPGFSPEEQYRSRGDQGSWTDVYSIGAVLYKMVTGVTPPDALERRAMFEGQKHRDILKPIAKYCPGITANQETAILNALNVRIEDRTPDMETLALELTSEEPVERRFGKIKKIDVLKWPLWAKIGAPAVAVAVLVMTVLFAVGVIRFDAGLRTDINVPDSMSRVPSVVSQEIKVAQKRLKSAKLKYEIVDKQESEAIEPNRVLAQDLTAGTLVPSNSLLKIKISAGAAANNELKEGVMPDVTFRTEREMKKMLDEAGISYEIGYEESETVAKGVVIRQSVGKGKKTESVTITVSTGAPAFAVPNTVGSPLSAAKVDLESRGLSVRVEYEESSRPEGTVLRQEPPSGQVRRGDSVTLVISSGQSAVYVPDVVGVSESAAKSALQNEGFDVYVSEHGRKTLHHPQR